MKSTSFKYLTKQGLNSLWKNRIMSLASIGVLVVCLILVGAAGMFSANVNQMMSFVQSQNEALVLANNDATQAQLDEMKKAIENTPNVDSVTFTSKDEALEEEKDKYGEYADALDTFKGDKNPLSDSFSVTFVDLSKTAETVSELEKIPNVKKVSVMIDVADNMAVIGKVLYIGGIVIVVILIIVAMVIISNTVKMTVFNRRKEIFVMKYVGATDSFIRLPFIIEGATLGLVSSVIAYILLLIGYNSLFASLPADKTSILGQLAENMIPFSHFWLPLLLFFIVAGLSVGVFGSGLFVRKHLKV